MDADLYMQVKTFLKALSWTQPRILAMFICIPIFARQLLPGLLRLPIAVALGAFVAPTLIPTVIESDFTAVEIALLAAKESFIGFVLGYMVAILFWAFEAIGFLIDNQRGASIAASLNPLTGNDSSPLGILFNQAFIVFFFISGGFTMLLSMLYDSFTLWNVFTWTPTLRPESVPLMLEQLSRLARLAMLLAAPAIVAMFMAEMGLAFVSRFVPQLQVFFMAMPIKSALAILVLMLYMSTLFEYSMEHLRTLRSIAPVLNEEWRAPPGETR